MRKYLTAEQMLYTVWQAETGRWRRKYVARQGSSNKLSTTRAGFFTVDLTVSVNNI